MSDAFLVLITFAGGSLLGYFLTRRTVGERRWRDGYLYGFNLAWDEKAKVEQEAADRRVREIRKRRPRFQLIKGEKV